MEEVLSQLNTVLQEGNSTLASIKKDREILNAEKYLHEERSKDLDNRENLLVEREKAVASIEDLVSFKKDAKELMDNALISLGDIKEQTKAFEAYKQLETSKLNNLRDITNREVNSLQSFKKSIDDEVNKRVQEFLKKIGVNDATTA